MAAALQQQQEAHLAALLAAKTDADRRVAEQQTALQAAQTDLSALQRDLVAAQGAQEAKAQAALDALAAKKEKEKVCECDCAFICVCVCQSVSLSVCCCVLCSCYFLYHSSLLD